MRGAAGRVGEIGQATPHADAHTGPIVFRVLTHPMRGVGNLCIGADTDPRYDARRLVDLLIAGLRRR